MNIDRVNKYQLITLDPGGTIGWAHFVVDVKAFITPRASVLQNLVYWDCGELSDTEYENCLSVSEMAYRARYGASGGEPICLMDVVSEDFELTQLIGGWNLLSPVRLNAVIGWEIYRRCSIELQLQKRQMRTQVTRERLKLMGFDERWGKDEFAAMQHGITYLRRLKARSKELPWKLGDSMKLPQRSHLAT